MSATADERAYPKSRSALAGVEIVPRYARDLSRLATRATLFGTDLAAPLAVAPIGFDGAIWPGASRALAGVSRDLRLACVSSTFATAPLEEIARLSPDRAWFQLYSFPLDDHRLTFDLVARAAAAGMRLLCLTLDVPLTARRVRDMRHGIRLPPKLTPRLIAQSAVKPAWLAALSREGRPNLANLVRHAPAPDDANVAAFVAGQRAGAGADWDLVARVRAAWQGPMAVKGILHAEDARRAQKLGLDGVIVSAHGGRQFDAAPAPIDVLPAIREAVGPDLTVMMDGGIMSGLDILRAIACGADGVLAGRAFMIGLAALGPDGARFVAETLIDEFRIALGQSGAVTVAGARALSVRHTGRWTPDDFDAPAS